MNRESGSYRIPFIVVTSLFFLWGFITVLVDALIPRLKAVFELSFFEAGLAQFAFFLAYALVSIPSGYLIARIGYKKGVVVGLIAMAAACLVFWPAAEFRIFGVFLVAMFMLAGGITTLQVAANPYVAALGPAETSSSRLNLAQAFNSLGTTLAPLVSAAFILGTAVLTGDEIAALSESAREAYFEGEAGGVQGPFLVLAGVLAMLAIAFGRFNLPAILDTDHHRSGNYGTALRSSRLMLGALGIFVYVGAEVAIGSYMVNYFLNSGMPQAVLDSAFLSGLATWLSGSDPSTLVPARIAGTFLFFYWGGAMVGRFIGAAVMQRFRPGMVLAAFALGATTLLLVTVAATGAVAIWAPLFVGLCNSVMFPTIFTLGIRDLDEHTAQGSGILCTAIVGGAIIPPLFGAIGDSVGLQLAFLLPAACYVYIAWYGRAMARRPAPVSA
ncbi:MAG: sugar MFS transporter [Rhodothermales bacterium]|nr:sugar MFS transporter [Rhodothermales bacterium]